MFFALFQEQLGMPGKEEHGGKGHHMMHRMRKHCDDFVVSVWKWMKSAGMLFIT